MAADYLLGIEDRHAAHGQCGRRSVAAALVAMLMTKHRHVEATALLANVSKDWGRLRIQDALMLELSGALRFGHESAGT
jgi:hypothetical protein